MVENRLEVTLFKLQDLNLVAVLVFCVASLVQHFLKVGEEVLLECRVFDVVSRVEHTTESMRNLFGFGVQCDGNAVVHHLDIRWKWLVLRGEYNTVVLQGSPLGGAVSLGWILPPAVLLLSLLAFFLVFLLCSSLAFSLCRSGRSFCLLHSRSLLFQRRIVIVGFLLLDLLCAICLLRRRLLGLAERFVVVLAVAFLFHGFALRFAGFGSFARGGCLFRGCLLDFGLFLLKFLAEWNVVVGVLADLVRGSSDGTSLFRQWHVIVVGVGGSGSLTALLLWKKSVFCRRMDIVGCFRSRTRGTSSLSESEASL